jgi:hypothetical protein
MDFHFWEKTGSEKHKCQMRFIEEFGDHFTVVDGFRTDTSDAFLYRKAIDFHHLRRELLLPV